MRGVKCGVPVLCPEIGQGTQRQHQIIIYWHPFQSMTAVLYSSCWRLTCAGSCPRGCGTRPRAARCLSPPGTGPPSAARTGSSPPCPRSCSPPPRTCARPRTGRRPRLRRPALARWTWTWARLCPRCSPDPAAAPSAPRWVTAAETRTHSRSAEAGLVASS